VSARQHPLQVIRQVVHCLFSRSPGTHETGTTADEGVEGPAQCLEAGNGATILLYNRAKQTIILTRQFRFPTFVNGSPDGMLVEACAGLLDQDDPVTCIRREAEEETGYQIKDVRKVFEAYMSPGSVTERLYFFVGEYADSDKVSEGGGHHHEGEDIEVLELGLDEALAQVAAGTICDGKTIMLLQYAKLHGLMAS
jgi:GDP-mannose pyrophosphatase NudK